MFRLGENLKRWIMSYSFPERKKRELLRYKEKVANFERMEIEELDLEYINLKTRYERRKAFLSIFMLSIVFSVLMDTWTRFYSFVENIMGYAFSYSGDHFVLAEIVVDIFSFMIIFVTVMVLVVLISCVIKVYQIYNELLIVEDVRKKRNK